ncbi:hypothetical protein D3C83_73100 [compost metagenome]
MDSDDIAYLLYQVGGSSTRPLFGQPPLPLTLRDGRAVAFWLCPPSVRPPKRRKSDIFQDLFGK